MKPEGRYNLIAPSSRGRRDDDVNSQELFAPSPDGIRLIDAKTQRVIECNDAACRQLGYTREAFARLRTGSVEP